MDHSALMRFLQTFTDVESVLQNLFQRQRAFARAVGQSLALEIFHDEVAGAVVRTDVVQLTDIGMVQTGDGTCLAVKALLGFRIGREMRRQDLDGYRALEASVAGAIHLSVGVIPRGATFRRKEGSPPRNQGAGNPPVQLANAPPELLPTDWRTCASGRDRLLRP